MAEEVKFDPANLPVGLKAAWDTFEKTQYEIHEKWFQDHSPEIKTTLVATFLKKVQTDPALKKYYKSSLGEDPASEPDLFAIEQEEKLKAEAAKAKAQKEAVEAKSKQEKEARAEQERKNASEKLLEEKEAAAKKLAADKATRASEAEKAKVAEETAALGFDSSKIKVDLGSLDLDSNVFGLIKLRDVQGISKEKIVDLPGLKVKIKLLEVHVPNYTDKLKAKKAPEVDWSFFDWDDPVVEDIMAMAQYVIMNGPVGVHKETNWPGLIGSWSIASKFEEAKYPLPLSNNMWIKFCTGYANCVNLDNPAYKTCLNVQRFGEVWPFCDKKFVAKKSLKERAEEEAYRKQTAK